MRELPLEGRTKIPLLFFLSRSARGLEQGENTAGPCAEIRDYRRGAIEAIVYRSCSTRNSPIPWSDDDGIDQNGS